MSSARWRAASGAEVRSARRAGPPVRRRRCQESTPPADEEVEAIKAQIDLLVGGDFVDADGARRELTLADILVVAPYNAQVRCLPAAMPGARVGTVDKFQGQEAPVVLFAMTSSSGDDVPRGLDFLFSKNRLNVAASRAQALAVVVCSPRCCAAGAVGDMELINMLCRFADRADWAELQPPRAAAA